MAAITRDPRAQTTLFSAFCQVQEDDLQCSHWIDSTINIHSVRLCGIVLKEGRKGKAGGVALVAEGLLSMLEGQSSKPRPS